MRNGRRTFLKACMLLAAVILAGGLLVCEVWASDFYEIAVAAGSTVTFEPEGIALKSLAFDKTATVTDDVRGSASFVMYESTTGKRKAEITGKQVGTSVATMTYLDSEGVERTQTLYIRVTDPEVELLDDVFVHGRTYSPVITGTAGCSSMYLAAKNTSILKTEYRSALDSVFVPDGIGAVKVAVVTDGRVYLQTVTVINPVMSQDKIMVEKKETAQLSVDGIPPTMKVTYRSSNKKVATVSTGGAITGKKNGTCTITARVYVSDSDVIKLKCKVTVGTKKSLLAVKEAEAVLGAKYSQAKRMQKGYYDCSSLVWRSYAAAGLPLGEEEYAPVAADIAKKLEKKWTVVATKYVSPDMLKPGDLIFYKSTKTKDRYKSIGHVAIYYGSYSPEGSDGTDVGRIIHANSKVELSEYSSFRKSKIVLILRYEE